MKIVGFELNYFLDGQPIRTSAVDYLRVVQPLKYIKKNTDWDVEIRRDPFVNGDKNWQDITKRFDLAFTGYNISKESAYINLRVHGMHNNCDIVVDMDDNLWDITSANPVYERIHPGTPDHSRIEAIMRDVPYVTCTQPFLRDRILHYTHRPSISTFNIDNQIDLNLYNPTHIEDDKIVIFYAGSHTHFPDVNMPEFVDSIRYILDTYPNVHFWMMGMYTTKFMKYGKRFRYIEGNSDYFKFLEIWNKEVAYADIAVAPLFKNDFSKGKSSIKFLEYSAAHVPTIASNVYPYRRERSSDVIYAETKDDWTENLIKLVENEQYRRNLGEKNYQYVKERRNIEKNWVLWKNLFEDITNKKYC